VSKTMQSLTKTQSNVYRMVQKTDNTVLTLR